MKNTKRQGRLLFFLLAILSVSIIISAYISNKGRNWFIIVMGVIALFLPALFGVIPCIENYRIKKNWDKNHLSPRTFTDRKDDIIHILEKLSTTEHILEISGNEKQCGKTWIAKKIVDYINHPDEYHGKKIKIPYQTAQYFDMNQHGISEIEKFFKDNIVNAKTVLIFDHVSDMSYILTKQSSYHFQLIYILQNECDYNFFRYNVSIFQESKINDLQNNIKKYYLGIDNLLENEIHTLYSLTAGNIGKIHAMLSTQRCVKWIKDITAGVQTDYDEELYRIKMELLIGEYQSANNRLEQFRVKNEQFFPQNNALYYKYMLIKADCEHLLNHYESAIKLISIIETDPYHTYNRDYELELYKAHYYKHLWKCNDALELLHNISLLTYSAKVDSLGILLAKYFIDDLFVPYSDSNSLVEFLNLYKSAYDTINSANAQDNLKCRRCTAIYLFYQDKPSNVDDLILKITEVINRYQAEHDRLLANAYFIRGEIYRLYEQYEKAIEDYARTVSVTVDNNIIIQTNLIIFYLRFCKKIDVTFNFLSENEIIHLCQKNNYAQIVWRRINSIRLGDPPKEHIINCFDSRIMPIL